VAASSKRSFPALTTRRLHLRLPKVEDTAAFGNVLSLAEVTRHTNWPDAPTPARMQRYMRWMAKLHGSGKGCAWIIEEARSGALVGAIRFNSIEKRWRCAVLGYEAHPDFWGRGLMTEAVRAVVACGRDTFRLNRIEAWTLPGNGASDRVLEKAGFRYEGTLRQRAWFKGAFHDLRMFGWLAEDAAAPRAARDRSPRTG
jgi:ribosomal-protein-alanine N-acetyltransferase